MRLSGAHHAQPIHLQTRCGAKAARAENSSTHLQVAPQWAAVPSCTGGAPQPAVAGVQVHVLAVSRPRAPAPPVAPASAQRALSAAAGGRMPAGHTQGL